jgi:hypothetical protein
MLLRGVATPAATMFVTPGIQTCSSQTYFWLTIVTHCMEGSSGKLQLYAVRPSALPNGGTPTDALSLGGVKILPLVGHHGALDTGMSNATGKHRRLGLPGPQ